MKHRDYQPRVSAKQLRNAIEELKSRIVCSGQCWINVPFEDAYKFAEDVCQDRPGYLSLTLRGINPNAKERFKYTWESERNFEIMVAKRRKSDGKSPLIGHEEINECFLN